MTAARLLGHRLLASLVTLLGVSILVFVIARVIPGDPARMALGATADNEQVRVFRERLGLDQPIYEQYLIYVRGVLRGDFGTSLYTSAPVADDLSRGFPATMELVLIASVLMVLVGIPLGIVAAKARDSALDNIARIGGLLGIVTPSFVWAVLLMLLFSDVLGWLPIKGRLSEDLTPPGRITGLYVIDALLQGDFSLFLDAARHVTLPAIALSLAGIGQAMRLTRANVAESLRQPYVEMVRAYGLPEWKIAFKYATPPALTPTLTVMGMDIAAKLGSAFLVESVFAWPGMANYGARAILNKDLNGIVGTVLVIAAVFLVINMGVDLIVSVLDPRIRLARHGRS